MALRRVNSKVEVLDVSGSKVHAIKPDKSVWDEYTDELFERKATGEVAVKSSKAIRALYRMCVKKIENAEVEKDGVVAVETITDPDSIVEFLSHIDSVEAGREIDSWLLGLASLTKAEEKNSSGEPPHNSPSPTPQGITIAKSASQAEEEIKSEGVPV